MAPFTTAKAGGRDNNPKASSNNGVDTPTQANCSSNRSSSSSARERTLQSREKLAGSKLLLKNSEPAKRTATPATGKAGVATCSDPSQPVKRAVRAYPLPSAALHKHKQASVFTSGKKKYKTNFASAYDSGSIPCRINHGSIRNALQWTKDPNSLAFNPLLITCAEGFLETEHPFVFLARSTFRELLKLEDAREKTLPILGQVIVPLRGALMAKNDDAFLMALEATRLLSDLVEGEMNVYLPKLTQQIHRKLLTKALRSEVEDTLAVLESNGGKEALTIIRSKIPTYSSMR